MISVCIATYNGADFISDQLLSVLSQVGGADEIIISDNLSSDSTLEVIRSIGDSRIHIFSESKKGVVCNFQNALAHASGDFIFLADQDDVWLPGKVEKVIQSLKNSDLVLHDANVVDANLNLIAHSLFSIHKSSPGLIKNWYKNSYVGCCMAFRRQVLDAALPIPDSVAMHDWWIGLVAESRFRVEFINEPLIQYRRHLSNASETSGQSKSTFMQKIGWRASIAYNLLKLQF